MKRLLVLILALAMLCSLLTACGGGSKPSSAASSTASSAASSAAPADDAEEEDEEEEVDEEEEEPAGDENEAEFLEAMAVISAQGDDLIGSLEELLATAETLDESEIEEFLASLVSLQEPFEAVATMLDAGSAEVPEGYEEAYSIKAESAIYINNGLVYLLEGVQAGVEGDIEAFTDALVESTAVIAEGIDGWQSVEF